MKSIRLILCPNKASNLALNISWFEFQHFGRCIRTQCACNIKDVPMPLNVQNIRFDISLKLAE